MKQTRLRLKQVSFLIRFQCVFSASLQAQFLRYAQDKHKNSLQIQNLNFFGCSRFLLVKTALRKEMPQKSLLLPSSAQITTHNTMRLVFSPSPAGGRGPG
jgi:hypothetical protein